MTYGEVHLRESVIDEQRAKTITNEHDLAREATLSA